MGGPICEFYMAKVTEAGYQLPKAEQDQLGAKLEEGFQQVGGKHLILCNSAWASEQTHFWGVDEFPDMEALQKYSQLESELNLFRYVDSWSILGTK